MRAAAALLVVVATVPAAAQSLSGGMGLTVWPQAAPVEGVALGISGRLQALLGPVRLEAGLVQGEVSGDDLSRAKRSLIFAAAAWRLGGARYALLGARLGALHLVAVETVGRDPGGARLVEDLESWTPVLTPTLAAGVALTRKIQLELEGGLVVDFTGDGPELSGVVVLGVYFRVGGR